MDLYLLMKFLALHTNGPLQGLSFNLFPLKFPFFSLDFKKEFLKTISCSNAMRSLKDLGSTKAFDVSRLQ